nr:putative disease resistance rpp13-like protein 1 [Quercus suber]
MKQSPSMPTSPSVDDSEVFGRDDDKEAIFELLLSDDASGEELSVIPIVGEEFLLSPFEGAAKASRVIVTTCIQSVASMVGTESAYIMRELSNTDCWSLFTKFAFGDQDLNSYPELGVIGKEIVELFGGLPHLGLSWALSYKWRNGNLYGSA